MSEHYFCDRCGQTFVGRAGGLCAECLQDNEVERLKDVEIAALKAEVARLKKGKKKLNPETHCSCGKKFTKGNPRWKTSSLCMDCFSIATGY